MKFKISRRLFILQMLFFFAACETKDSSTKFTELVIGIISYGQEKQKLEQFSRFREYLGKRTRAIIQVEPTFNEKMAIERIKNYSWALVFASPGLAAIAKANYKYLPIFPLAVDINLRSIFVVRKDSPLKGLKDLQNKKVALGLPGSATGYYFPLYNLYGLTLAEILFAPTPKTVLEWVAQNKAAAGALSLQEFNSHRLELNNVEFRILFSDPQIVPPGAVLLSPKLDQNRQELIRNSLKEAPPTLIQDFTYVTNEEVPNYEYMISVVNRVTSLTTDLRAKPTRIF
ncbi:PhnD/SsuA/transferrin family substrate-binding protein [Calothrix sp. FACHB-156]|nr:PhnD/SsuA/transferrin family substrate-binding protein [Calothrix sp. FACHB-156]